MMTLAQFEATYAGAYIDVDDAAGNQCWDLAQLYYTLCINPAGTLWTVPGAAHPGYAIGSWEGFAVNGLSKDFVQISADQPAQYGDIVICAWGSASYPVSHVFIALADAGNLIYSLSQNSSPARTDLPGYSPESSGPTVRQYLLKDRIAGYLRPKANIAGQSSTIEPIQEDDVVTQEDRTAIVAAILDTQVTQVGGGKISLRDLLAEYRPHVSETHLKLTKLPTAVVNAEFPRITTEGKVGGTATVGTVLGAHDANVVLTRGVVTGAAEAVAKTVAAIKTDSGISPEDQGKRAAAAFLAEVEGLNLSITGGAK